MTGDVVDQTNTFTNSVCRKNGRCWQLCYWTNSYCNIKQFISLPWSDCAYLMHMHIIFQPARLSDVYAIKTCGFTIRSKSSSEQNPTSNNFISCISLQRLWRTLSLHMRAWVCNFQHIQHVKLYRLSHLLYLWSKNVNRSNFYF